MLSRSDTGAEVRRFASAVNAVVPDVATRRQRRAQELVTTRPERLALGRWYEAAGKR